VTLPGSLGCPSGGGQSILFNDTLSLHVQSHGCISRRVPAGKWQKPAVFLEGFLSRLCVHKRFLLKSRSRRLPRTMRTCLHACVLAGSHVCRCARAHACMPARWHVRIAHHNFVNVVEINRNRSAVIHISRGETCVSHYDERRQFAVILQNVPQKPEEIAWRCNAMQPQRVRDACTVRAMFARMQACARAHLHTCKPQACTHAGVRTCLRARMHTSKQYTLLFSNTQARN